MKSGRNNSTRRMRRYCQRQTTPQAAPLAMNGMTAARPQSCGSHRSYRLTNRTSCSINGTLVFPGLSLLIRYEYFHGTNVSGERQRLGAIDPWSTSGAGPQAKPKAAAVGHSHGTNDSRERQRPGALGPCATSGAGPQAKPKAAAVGHFHASTPPATGEMSARPYASAVGEAPPAEGSWTLGSGQSVIDTVRVQTA